MGLIILVVSVSLLSAGSLWDGTELRTTRMFLHTQGFALGYLCLTPFEVIVLNLPFRCVVMDCNRIVEIYFDIKKEREALTQG